MSEKKTVVVLAGLSVKDADAFIKAAIPIVELVRQEVGCVRYDLVQDVLDKNTFFFIEEYLDDEAFATHRTMPYMDGFRQIRAKLVEKYLGVDELKRISTR